MNIIAIILLHDHSLYLHDYYSLLYCIWFGCDELSQWSSFITNYFLGIQSYSMIAPFLFTIKYEDPISNKVMSIRFYYLLIFIVEDQSLLLICASRSKFTSIANMLLIIFTRGDYLSISGLNIILFPTVIICFRYFGS